MIKNTFLDKLAKVILDKYSQDLSNIVIILPNKRAKVFLIEALKNKIDTAIFVPQIESIEEFVQEISHIRAIDPIELLFEFYEVYLSITDKKHHQEFEIFANWAKTLLQDFNEIDRYLLDPSHVLTYLKDIEDIKRWGIDVENKTKLLENYIDFWKLLPLYYQSLYEHLLTKKIGYQGLIYREAINNLKNFSKNLKDKKFIFAGFNALNTAEENIIQTLIATNKAEILWDAELTFMNDPQHDAGLFLRRFKSKWPHYKINPFEWIFDEFSGSKNISIIGTPKTVGQAKITGNIIEQILSEIPDSNLNNVAVVLGEENLLVPLLYTLPSTVGALNITMGYSAKNNPAQTLITKLFKLHTNAIARNPTNYVFYYKDLVDILTHPLVEPYAQTKTLIQIINRNNYTFITHKKLFELQPSATRLFELLFSKWQNGPIAVLEVISDLLYLIKNNFNTDNEQDKIAKAFVFSVFTTVNKLINYYTKHNYIDKIDTLFAIYKQVIELAEVSFEGEPLNGLQIMGVLESRVLDFETVIVTSMNEGKFPAGKSMNSFIPHDVKRELGLPTYKEKDAIYTYHFYHLIQRATNVYLLYNTENDGLDGGEKSRFITQLQIEKQDNHTITDQIYNPILPHTPYKPLLIPKSEKVQLRIKKICETGFSPSALTSYIRNPIDFYFQKILQIQEIDEVEENIELNTLGTIIHEALKHIYLPFIGKYLTVLELQSCFENLDEIIGIQFQKIYKEGEIKKGKNLLAYEVAKQHVKNFLTLELAALQKGETIKIIALEQTFARAINHPSLPYEVLLKGNVDRIEKRNNTIRIIDYKTGKVDAAHLTLKSWNQLTNDIKNDKIIQILAYAYMFDTFENIPLEAGIISFKNLKSGFLPFNFKEPTTTNYIIKNEIMTNYIEQIVVLLKEILDASIPFKEKI